MNLPISKTLFTLFSLLPVGGLASPATNDLPSIYLSCSETVDGADVLDGSKDLTIFKDQFSQHSARLVQKDQFSGDTVLAMFSILKKTTSNRSEIFTGSTDNSRMKFEVAPSTSTLIGTLLLNLEGDLARSKIMFRCKKPRHSDGSSSLIWHCSGKQDNEDISAVVNREEVGSFTGSVTRSTPNSNGSIRSHSWIYTGLKHDTCDGFTPCDLFSKKGDLEESDKLEMFINYNNTEATSGIGHLLLNEQSIMQIDADLICTRNL